LPNYIQNFIENSEFLNSLPFDISSFIDSSQIINGLQGAFGFVSRIFGGLAGLGIAIIISLYMIIDKESIISSLIKYLPENKKPNIKTTIYRIDKNLSSWLLSQLILSLIIGVLSYIGLSLLGIDYALPLAVLAAFLELIPNLGPIITFFIMVFISIATGQTITITVLVGIWFIMQQMLENYVIVPRLMKRVVGLSPVITIAAIIAGSMAFGLLGAVVAVPVVKTISIIVDEYLKTRQEIVEGKIQDS
jgi:predicted PurR-regulated permease PerM